MPLNRDQILAFRASPLRMSVEVPELGGEVLIRILSLAEVDEIQKSSKGGNLSIYPKFIVASCVNEDGSPMFVGEDVKLISGLSFAVTDRLVRAILKFNRLDADEKKGDPSPSSPTNDSA